MHELAFAQSLLKSALRAAQRSGAGRILALRLSLGDYSDVIPSYLEKCFAQLSRGGMAEGARLEIERVRARVRCEACGAESSLAKGVFLCPHCKSARIRLLSGTGCTLESIEVE